MNPNPKVSRADSAITPCVQITRDGGTCGKPGQIGLPPGVCPEHGIAIYRAVTAMISEETSK